jgi:hypothetical protein
MTGVDSSWQLTRQLVEPETAAIGADCPRRPVVTGLRRATTRPHASSFNAAELAATQSRSRSVHSNDASDVVYRALLTDAARTAPSSLIAEAA